MWALWGDEWSDLDRKGGPICPVWGVIEIRLGRGEKTPTRREEEKK
jgi:hypothetical protein